MTSKEIRKLQTLVSKLKLLKTQRKAFHQVAEAGGDCAMLAVEVAKIEDWFKTNYPRLNIASNLVINAAQKEARETLKQQQLIDAATVAVKRRGKTALIDMDTEAENTGTATSRKEATAVRRSPVRSYAHKV